MQDKSINNALLALRKQIIRGDGQGLEHVEALLALRDVPMPAVLPTKKTDVAKCGSMTRMVLEALRGGPRQLGELVDYVSARRPEIDAEAAYHRTSLCLNNMRLRGFVRRDDRVWRLAP